MMGMLYRRACNLCLYNAARSFDIHLWLFLAFCNLSLTFSWHSDSAVSIPRPWLPICVCFLALIAAHPGICHMYPAFLFTHLHFHRVPFLFSSASETASFRRDAAPQPRLTGEFRICTDFCLATRSSVTQTDGLKETFRHIVPQKSRTGSQLCFNARTLTRVLRKRAKQTEAWTLFCNQKNRNEGLKSNKQVEYQKCS